MSAARILMLQTAVIVSIPNFMLYYAVSHNRISDSHFNFNGQTKSCILVQTDTK